VITAVRRITSLSDIDGSRLSSRLDDDELAAPAAPFSPICPLPEIRTRPRQQLYWCGGMLLRVLAALVGPTAARAPPGAALPNSRGRASNTPDSGVPQSMQRPSSARCQRVSSNESRPINSRPQPAAPGAAARPVMNIACVDIPQAVWKAALSGSPCQTTRNHQAGQTGSPRMRRCRKSCMPRP